MRVALLGTRGVPAAYGGFETAAEEVGRRLVERGHDVTVYCRPGGARGAPREYLGMRTVHLPALRLKWTETLSHTALSAVHVQGRRPDVAVVFNSANALTLPILRARRIPVAVHMDGIEWQRGKWGRVASSYSRLAERLAVRWADALIADSAAIQAYFRDRYGVDSTYLAYGAPLLGSAPPTRLPEGLGAGGYHLIVARFEPENNVDLLIRGYRASSAELPLLVVGGASYSRQCGEAVAAAAAGDARVRLVGPVWDQCVLDELYANARSYLHGHSVGGTNPSLLRAMGAGAPVIAIDVPFTREVAAGTGRYFASVAELAGAIEETERDAPAAAARGGQGRDRVARLYDWDAVAAGYEALCARLAGG